MNVLLEKFVAIARTEVGTRESGGNNMGARIAEYQKATWLPVGPWPWCAAFVCWVMREWVKSPDVQKHFGITALAANTWRCRDAAAFGVIKWAEKNTITIYREDKETDAPDELAKAGDIVVFDFSHVGIVVKDQLNKDELVQTVEGNTNGKGERDSTFGDGVWLKRRRPVEILALIRLIQ